ncbi:hypothetical protein ACFSKU_20330 [Pontibacter silvestris]|uniref:DUF4843 domain-containing protein n=1 Tax=Pontibacter silvestris TaxID=2305183 RepID=A0ABW4X2N3_9BACT|nr:hypothetical protein [Pontibacter silvestris]MCC9137053.1 hypothetical protein [Pontibacter silvestris]
MKNIILLFSLLFTVALTSCEKDEYTEFYSDNRPEIPVTFPGTTTYGFNPYITHSISGGGNIEFTLAIPENSGRTIKEITKIVAGSTSINAGTVTSADVADKTGKVAVVSYNNATPIPVNSTTATFTTTLEEFKSKTEEAAKTDDNKLVKDGGEIAFMFLITLDNDQTIIPVQVRVRLTE